MENSHTVVKIEVDEGMHLNVKKEIFEADELMVHEIDFGAQNFEHETSNLQKEASFVENICPAVIKSEYQYDNKLLHNLYKKHLR